MWVDANWWDICSDLSAFHRIDDPVAVAPQRLIDLAARLPAYSGVVAARDRVESQPPTETGSGVVDGSAEGIGADPVLGGWFEFEQA